MKLYDLILSKKENFKQNEEIVKAAEKHKQQEEQKSDSKLKFKNQKNGFKKTKQNESGTK
tara:strand:+ start:617 stop:796 length:180 start_codon:yes stop_codon:yes gene_type:complete